MADPNDPYKILQVDPEAEDEVIQAAYRRLARKYHPDLAETPEAAARMSKINAAWELIGDPVARRAYDRTRSTVSARPASGAGTSDRSDGSARPGSVPPSQPPAPRPPETVSRDWTSGRSNEGGGFDESMRAAEGFGAAGPPPGRPSGTVLNFGRYAGWSLGEVARHDIEYIEWLDRAPIGRNYRQELDDILRSSGRRRSAEADDADRRGLYRRR
ncbi:MAG TPA: DnaJ domain-containing protein [Candidatus Limnocylindrales bacterium]|nr:DnaJ domain-containing protein [Candidatus Limnocylindrales bacterium]